MYFAILFTSGYASKCDENSLMFIFCNNAHTTCVSCISAVRAACELQIAAVKISLNANAAILRLHINPLQCFVFGRKTQIDAKPRNITT